MGQTSSKSAEQKRFDALQERKKFCKQVVGTCNDHGAKAIKAFIGSDNQAYMVVTCPTCGDEVSISRLGWTRFKGCKLCRNRVSQGNPVDRPRRHYEHRIDQKELMEILSPENIWKRICERKFKRESSIDEIAWSSKCWN